MRRPGRILQPLFPGPDDDQELFTLPELVEAFSFERVNKSGAVFDRDKLDWMNQQYIQNLDEEDLYLRLQPFIAKTSFAETDESILKKAVAILKTRMVRLDEIDSHLQKLLQEHDGPVDAEVAEVLKQENAKTVLSEFAKEVENSENRGEENLGAIVKSVQKTTGIKGKNLWMPLRYAITLEVAGPDLKMLVDLYGKEKCLRLVKNALEL